MRAIIIAFLCFGILADVKAQQLRDITLIQGYGDDAVSVAHSDHGILFAGRYGGTGVVVGGDTLYPSNGLGDMFIGLMNESLSEILWIRSIGGYNAPGVFEDCSIVAISNDGFYISGTFGGPFSVDAHQAVVRGGQDAFLAKFDYSGNCLWLKSAGGVMNDRGGPAVLTADNKILWMVYGENSGTIDTFNVSKGGYLVTLDIDGSVLAVRDHFTTSVRFYSMAIQGSSIYCSGQTENDSSAFGSIQWVGNNMQDIVLAKCDLNGNPIWARQLVSGRSGSGACELEVDDEGSLYVTGGYYDSLSVDGNRVTGSNSEDVFVARFDSNGTNLWLINGASRYSWGFGLNMDTDSTFYVIGRFSDTLTMGIHQLFSSSSGSLFISRFRIDGECMGSSAFANSSGYSVTFDISGFPIISGAFYDSIQVQGITYTSWGQRDAFIGRMDKITGIANEARMDGNGLVIYANPNDGSFRIRVPASLSTLKGARLTVYDSKGSLVEQFIFDSHTEAPIVRLRNAMRGQYVLRLEQDGRVFSGRLIVK